jgi:hypothetical protein
MKYNQFKISNTLKRLGYKVFTKPYELNIIGLRTTDQPNKFDDTLVLFYTDDKGAQIYKEYPITTDPGTYWLNNPMNVNGTAMLKAGQYLNTWAQGLHRNSYKALTQVKPVTVYRDNDRNSTFQSNKEDTGYFGINIHKALNDTNKVDKFSAGCQVFKRTADFNEFMKATDKSRELYGNKFTYTLLDAVEVEKKKRRRLILLIGAGLIGTYIYTNVK